MKATYIASIESFMESIEAILKAEVLSLDIETTGLNPRKDSILLIQLGSEDNNFIFDVAKLPKDRVEYLVEVIKDKLLVGFNLKFDIQFIKEKYGILFKNLYCNMLVEKIITAGLGNKYPSLEDVVNKYFDIELAKDVRESFHESFDGVITKEQINYAAQDVHYLLPLKNLQDEHIELHSLEKVVSLEMRLLPVVSQMELNGVLLNIDEWNKLTRHAKRFARRLKGIIDNTFRKELHRYITSTENSALDVLEFFKVSRERDVEIAWKEATGFEKRAYRKAYAQMLSEMFDLAEIDKIFFAHFNPNSTNQKKKMLNWMGIVTDTIDQKVLKRDFPTNRFVKTMIRYGEEYKKAYTYGDNMLEHIDPVSGRIHANANQLGATTGRFAYSGPNLQNQISDPKYRKCYIARDDKLLITADYSQIELRILGEITGEPRMIKAYLENEDIHANTAAAIYGVPLDQVTKLQRTRGKNTNFAVVYGATARGLAYNFSIEEKQGQEILRRMKLAYPVMTSFMSIACDEIIRRGYSVTPLGRKRFFRISDYTRSLRGTKERMSIQRQGFNHIIQGCAADIMKIAIVNLYYENPFGDSLELLVTVHDEIVIEVDKTIVNDALKFIDNMMVLAGETFLSKIPVEVDKNVKPYWVK